MRLFSPILPVPLALGFGLGKSLVPGRLLLAGVAVSTLPDLDVIAFSFGIPYVIIRYTVVYLLAVFAAMAALNRAARALFAALQLRHRLSCFPYFLATVSHGVLTFQWADWASHFSGRGPANAILPGIS